MYGDTLMLQRRGFTSYMLMNNLVTNSAPARFTRVRGIDDDNEAAMQNSRIRAQTQTFRVINTLRIHN